MVYVGKSTKREQVRRIMASIQIEKLSQAWLDLTMGLQRFCTEHKIILPNVGISVDHIFLSRVCSETAGGLPGLLFTLADFGGLSVNVWGPSDLKYLVDAMKSFIRPDAMVHARSFGTSPSSDATLTDLTKLTDPLVLVNNEVVKISAILLKPNFSGGSAVKPGELSVIYVCELPELMGKFDPDKARALGLSSGPKYDDLKSGKSVQSDCGTMVHPSDVMGPSVPGPIVLLVDCPTEAHVLELLSVESLSSYYADCSSKCAKTVNCIIHLSPTSVTGTPNYQICMKRFGSAQHIMAGHEIMQRFQLLKSNARLSARLNYLCPQLFPAVEFCSLQHLNNSAPDYSASEGPVARLSESVSAKNLLKRKPEQSFMLDQFTLLPHAHLGLDRTEIPSLVALSELMDELHLEIPEIVDAAQHVSQIWQEPPETKEVVSHLHENEVDENRLPSCLENVRKDDLEIVLLGTGSARPYEYRNVSSIYINLFSKGSLLLDCGEGTLGQLRRRYGVEGADSAVRNLRCIWISHIHADHQAGLARILALRHDLLKGVSHEPLLVVGPAQLKDFLDAYQRLEDLDMQFINCRYTTESSWIDFKHNIELHKDPLAQGKKCFHEAGLETLISIPVVHCQEAFGIVLKASERINGAGKVIPGWKIVYSGDTRPCPALAEASCGATVLIHEASYKSNFKLSIGDAIFATLKCFNIVATYEDGQVADAVAKKHSTTKEAIEVGSGAYRIVLTHLCQRHPKIPAVDDASMHKTCIAFDLMSINLADLPVLPEVLPYLKLLCKDESDGVT
ncbi:hypothetical protein Patl1_34082 [Pistacia atlantica]|uniref:Uncharacterized protein n=1 Tax=Pistacia atlantica TaxID=434234 RepID=A0ACC0ZPW6_9ROSI|nr:hypothetical protein Patl1_34082 [Pistacia atlantica]